MKKLISLALTLALLVVFAAPAFALEKGDVIPEIEIALSDGESTLNLNDARGKVLVVLMWATWCPTCVAELPEIQALSEQYADDAVFVAVNSGEDLQTVQDFLAEKGYTFTVGMDAYMIMLTELFPSDYIPYTVIIDPEGKFAYDIVGGDMYTETVSAAIEELRLPAAEAE